RNPVISLRRNRSARSAPDALAESEELAQTGRRLEAIDVLMTVNRTARDPLIEQRLVNLRHDAFDELEARTGLPSWPPAPPPDLFPGGTLPEVRAGDFTAETLSSGILRHGCLAVRGLVPPKRVAQLTEDIDAAMDACARWESDRAADTGSWFAPFTVKGPSTLG